jgi:folate-binding protein YgfZ
MVELSLHAFHQNLGARFAEVNGSEVVGDYGDMAAEHAALCESAGVLDLGFRGRLCITGADRTRFLHGQVTNDVKALRAGKGCYAALITAKGRMESDLNIYCLRDELLLDFEPGLTAKVSQRLDKYIIADDVQIVDVATDYGLLSVQGPAAATVIKELGFFSEVPDEAFSFVVATPEDAGEIVLVNQPRLGSSGFDLFVPRASLETVAGRLMDSAKRAGGRSCGWQAFEMARIEAGIPRFGADMDESNIPLEAGLENRGISFSKGCYIGQEVISRIRTYGQVAKALRGLRLAPELKNLPAKGDKLFHAGKEIGYVTSAVASSNLKAAVALGYVRKEANQVGTELELVTAGGKSPVRIVELPFRPDSL